MIAEQYKQWKEFSLAMARGGFEPMTEPRWAKLVEWVERFFDACMEGYGAGPHPWEKVADWDNSDGDICVGDQCSEYFAEFDYYEPEAGRHERGKFCDALHICIRAGLDTAAEPSAGVIGFTVGDVRRMFGGSIPAWVNDKYNNDLQIAGDSEGIWL